MLCFDWGRIARPPHWFFLSFFSFLTRIRKGAIEGGGEGWLIDTRERQRIELKERKDNCDPICWGDCSPLFPPSFLVIIRRGN